MDRFLSGLTGIGLGFLIFLPSHLFASKTSGTTNIAEVDPFFLAPMILGMSLMYSSPLIFWVMLPAIEKLKN